MSAKGGEKLEIKVTKLKEVMDLMKPVVPRKPTVKSVACLCLGNGKAVATDLETMVIANLPEAKEPMLLPYSAIAEMLKYVPGNETLKIELKGKMVYLAWKDGNASYPTEDFMDFPVMPEMAARADGLVDGDILIAAMLAALPYTAADTTRPVLSGVTLVLGTPIEVAAGDGFRMSHQVLGLSFPLEEKVIIPSHAVAILDHVFKKTPRTPPSTAESMIKVVTAKRQLRMSLIGDNKLRLDFGTSCIRDHQPDCGQAAGMAGAHPQRRTHTAEPDLCSATGSGRQTGPGHRQGRRRRYPHGVCRRQAEGIR